MRDTLLIIITIVGCIVGFYAAITLNEIIKTLKSYRNLESRLIPILDNARRITSNVDDITQKVLIQTTRLEGVTENAVNVVEEVRDTIDKYNRIIASPILKAANIISGAKGIFSVLFKRRKEEDIKENKEE